MNAVAEWIQSHQGMTLSWFGAVFAVMAFFRYVSTFAESELADDIRDSLALRLMLLEQQKVGAWIPDFNRVFDRLFGARHLSWRCFFVSAAISVAMFCLVFFLISGAGELLDEITHEEDLSVKIGMYLGLGFVAALMNVLMDYLSLLETRWMLGLRINMVLKLVLDLVLTALIAYLWTHVAMYLLYLMSDVSKQDEMSFIAFCVSMMDRYSLILSQGGKVMEVLKPAIITTFFTSIWLWLYGLAQLTIRILAYTTQFVQILNIEKAPVRAIGVVINGYVFLFGCLGYLLNVAMD